MSQQINRFFIFQRIFKVRTPAFAGDGVVEHINRFIFADMLQIVRHPSEHVIQPVTWRMVASWHRGDNVMHVTYLKRIKCRSINLFE